MSGSDRGVPGPAGRGIEHDAAVSEIIGAVLLIALVVAGGTMVGVALFSQPFPTQVPKVNIVIGADENGTVTLFHNGGEALNPGQYHVYLDQTLWNQNQSFLNNNTNYPASSGPWSVGNSLALRESNASLTENVTIEYYGSSGNVTITSVKSVGTGGAGFGFFSALYEYLFKGGTPEWIVPLPSRQVTHYNTPGGAYAWPANMSPQINFTPVEGVAYVYQESSNPDYTSIENEPGVKIHFTDVNTINDALMNYGTVILVDGTYDCNGPIRCIQSNRILMAHNPGMALVPMHSGGYSDGYIKVSAQNVIIRGLSLYGTGGVEIVASNVSIQNVNVTSRELGYTPADPNEPPSNKAPINGMFFVWADGQNIDNVEFYNCTARECNTHGWNMNQNWNGQPYTISNTRFVNCRASYCGYGEAGDHWAGTNSSNTVIADHASRSEWITGFDLHEWQGLVGCHVFNCTADNNWESGFHFEPGARYDENGGDIGPRTVSEDVTLDNCTSIDNGRSTYGSAFFLSGYYLSRNTTLTNCTSVGNTNAGFYVHGGTNSQFINCTDTNSTTGFIVIKGSSDITIDNCTSTGNGWFALWAAFSENLQVKNFRQYNIHGHLDTQSILGWYKDDSRYGLPVTDSHFEINASGSSRPIINRAGGGNTYDLTPP